MIKRFSLENIVLGVQKTVRRFPLVMAVAMVGTVTGLILVHDQESALISKLFFTLLLAFPLLVATTIFTEQSDSRQVKVRAFSIVGVFLIFYFIFLSKNLFTTQQFTYHIQYILWLAGAFTLVTFSPFIKKFTDNSLNFWYYNQRIFYAFLATFIYSATIFIGLSIALLSVNFLFDLDIDSVRWVELWVVIAGVFSTTFILSRYPHIQASEENTPYPSELKLFTYYVLVPLVSIYFLILYSYTAKIILTWEWPKGIVSSMVLGFSALGIFTYSLLYPLILRENNLRKISKIFFGILLPQVAILFWAVWLRVSDYGITENRYLLIVFGLWLLGISLYFLISKVKNIRLIVISLFIILVVISFGPWGIFSISESSQIHRLANILQKNGILVDGQVNKINGEVSSEDKGEISEIIRYLNDNHDLQGIQPWFKQDLNTLSDSDCEINEFRHGCSKLERVTALIGVPYIDRHQVEEYSTFTAGENRNSQNLKVSGYDYVISNSSNVEVNGNQYSFDLNTKTLQYYVYKNGTIMSSFPLKAFFDQLKEKYKQSGNGQFTVEEMSVPFEDSNIKMRVYFSSISITNDNIWVSKTTLVKFK